MTFKTLRAAAAACALALAVQPAAPRAAEPVTPETLMIYAAFAKLEANIQETSLLVALSAVLSDDQAEERARLAREYESDVEKVARYVAVLRGAGITEAQRAVLDEFEAKWEPITVKGRSLLVEQANTDEYRRKTYNYWLMIDAVDDLIDDKLEEMRERHGADWPSSS